MKQKLYYGLVMGLCVALPWSASAQWPDTIYRLIDVNLAQGITPGLLTANTYVLLGSDAVPFYLNATSPVDVTSLRPTSAGTVQLNFFIEDKCVIKESELEIVVDQLQSRIHAIYLGLNLNWQLTIGSAPAGTSTAINVVVDEGSTSIYHADARTRTIRLNSGGLEPRILLHELGHILGLPHRNTRCNICTDITQHFMYEYLSDLAVIDQIMIQDWLQVSGVCFGNILCSDCTVSAGGYFEDNDAGYLNVGGIGKSFSPGGKVLFLQDTLKKGQFVSVQQYLDCIDCPAESVDTSVLQVKDLLRLFTEIPDAKRLRTKYQAEFNHYNSGRLELSESEIRRYIDKQVKRRQAFYKERVLTLVEFRLNHELGQEDKDKLQKLHSKLKGNQK